MQEQLIKWKQRPLSWSQISSFEYSPEQWFDKYILDKKSEPSAEMLFGSKVGKQLETDPTFLPMIPREKIMEYEFKSSIGEIQLIGYADSFCDDTYKLREYKSGVKAWDQKRVDNHGQITFYCFMFYLMKKVKPEQVECSLHWMPTKRIEKGDFTVEITFVDNIEENIKHFNTKRTTRDVLEFGVRINRVLKEMEEYAIKHT